MEAIVENDREKVAKDSEVCFAVKYYTLWQNRRNLMVSC